MGGGRELVKQSSDPFANCPYSKTPLIWQRWEIAPKPKMANLALEHGYREPCRSARSQSTTAITEKSEDGILRHCSIPPLVRNENLPNTYQYQTQKDTTDTPSTDRKNCGTFA